MIPRRIHAFIDVRSCRWLLALSLQQRVRIQLLGEGPLVGCRLGKTVATAIHGAIGSAVLHHDFVIFDGLFVAAVRHVALSVIHTFTALRVIKVQV